MGALANVMGAERDQESALLMATVKAIIGHMKAAAGIAGLIKAVLVLQNEQAPPNPELKTLNPRIMKAVGGLNVHFLDGLEGGCSF
jgi:acyl transferase domain-containing protein